MAVWRGGGSRTDPPADRCVVSGRVDVDGGDAHGDRPVGLDVAGSLDEILVVVAHDDGDAVGDLDVGLAELDVVELLGDQLDPWVVTVVGEDGDAAGLDLTGAVRHGA